MYGNRCGEKLFCNRNEKGFGSEIFPASVAGIVAGDALVSYWPICFPVPEVFAKVNSAQFLSRC